MTKQQRTKRNELASKIKEQVDTTDGTLLPQATLKPAIVDYSRAPGPFRRVHFGEPTSYSRAKKSSNFFKNLQFFFSKVALTEGKKFVVMVQKSNVYSDIQKEKVLNNILIYRTLMA